MGENQFWAEKITSLNQPAAKSVLCSELFDRRVKLIANTHILPAAEPVGLLHHPDQIKQVVTGVLDAIGFQAKQVQCDIILAFVYAQQHACVLDAFTGSGKTVLSLVGAALRVLCYRREDGILPVVVVQCPLTLSSQWSKTATQIRDALLLFFVDAEIRVILNPNKPLVATSKSSTLDIVILSDKNKQDVRYLSAMVSTSTDYTTERIMQGICRVIPSLNYVTPSSFGPSHTVDLQLAETIMQYRLAVTLVDEAHLRCDEITSKLNPYWCTKTVLFISATLSDLVLPNLYTSPNFQKRIRKEPHGFQLLIGGASARLPVELDLALFEEFHNTEMPTMDNLTNLFVGADSEGKKLELQEKVLPYLARMRDSFLVTSLMAAELRKTFQTSLGMVRLVEINARVRAPFGLTGESAIRATLANGLAIGVLLETFQTALDLKLLLSDIKFDSAVNTAIDETWLVGVLQDHCTALQRKALSHADRWEVTMAERRLRRATEVLDELQHPKAADCAICLLEFRAPDFTPVMQACCLQRNICGPCVQAWKRSNSSCPLCRRQTESFVLKQPGETPPIQPPPRASETVAEAIRMVFKSYACLPSFYTCFNDVIQALSNTAKLMNAPVRILLVSQYPDTMQRLADFTTDKANNLRIFSLQYKGTKLKPTEERDPKRQCITTNRVTVQCQANILTAFQNTPAGSLAVLHTIQERQRNTTDGLDLAKLDAVVFVGQNGLGASIQHQTIGRLTRLSFTGLKNELVMLRLVC